jgi:hypothetical protein
MAVPHAAALRRVTHENKRKACNDDLFSSSNLESIFGKAICVALGFKRCFPGAKQ